MTPPVRGDVPCPVCGAAATTHFLRVDAVPVHCNVLWPEEHGARSAPRGDLDMVFCATCGHIFNGAFDPARTTYGATYENSLHHSSVFQTYATELAHDLVARYGLRDLDIVEIGAGQGDFLELLVDAGGNRGTGFDPSFVDATATRPDIRLVAEFYDERFAEHPADVIVCRHVLEHIDQSGDFMAMVRRVVGDRSGTRLIFEVPDAEWTIRDGGVWDLIYEHCGYFSAPSMRTVFARNGFRVERLERVFGGQFLVLVAVPTAEPAEDRDVDGPAIAALGAAVESFADTYRAQIETWTRRFADLSRAGRRAVVWGAGSKGVMFLNLVDGHGVVDRAVDINPRKRGMYVSGSGQKIVAPDDLVAEPPDVVVVMNPNYRAEVASSLAERGIAAEVLVP